MTYCRFQLGDGGQLWLRLLRWVKGALLDHRFTSWYSPQGKAGGLISPAYIDPPTCDVTLSQWLTILKGLVKATHAHNLVV